MKTLPPGAGISPRFMAYLDEEPLQDLTVLDVGTGTGRLALALAPRCRRVIGVDREASAVEEARRQAEAAGFAHVEFVVADAEAIEYAAFTPGLVTAHLCLSDAIVERAGRALDPGRVLAFVAFHADQWRETGRRSRFAYDEDQARTVLARCGFAVERLEVEQSVQTFDSVEAALAAVAGLEDRWRRDGRWLRFREHLDRGGRTLTRSHLLGKARRR